MWSLHLVLTDSSKKKKKKVHHCGTKEKENLFMK